MSVDKTAEAILATEAPTFSSDTIADMVGQRIISDYHRELQAMAKLWLMRKDILAFFKDLDDSDKTESWAWNISERLRKQIQALEKE